MGFSLQRDVIHMTMPISMYYIVPLDRSVSEVMVIVLELLIFGDNFLIRRPFLSEHERESVCSDSIKNKLW